MYKDIHIQRARVLLFCRWERAHFPVIIIRVATRNLMIIRHDVNTNMDTTMSLGTDVHVERLPNIFCSLFGGDGREWASNIADYHVWPVEYHDFGPYCC